MSGGWDDERTGVFSAEAPGDPINAPTSKFSDSPLAVGKPLPRLEVPDTDKVDPIGGQPKAASPTDQVDADRFPALEKLKTRGRRKIPYVQQLHATDCGAASLSMVLAYHGRIVPLDELRHAMGTGRDGVSARAIAETAERYELAVRGVSVDLEGLKFLPTGTILHWEFRHFVVFERETRKGIQIVDPAGGRRLISRERFGQAFTGVALVCEPADAFETGGEKSGRVWAYLRQLLVQGHLLSRVIVTSVLLRLFALAVPILTAMIVDRVVPRGDHRLLLVVGAGLMGMIFFQFLSELIRAHLMLQLRTNLDTRMTLGFVDHLMGLSYDFFERRQAGDLMMRVNSNSTIRELLTANTLTALLDGTLVFVYLGAIVLFSPILAGIVLALGLMQVALFFLARRKIRDLMSEHLEAQARSQSYLVQMMSGVESLKTAGAEARAVEHWSNLFVDELNVGLKRGRVDAVVNSAMGALRLGAPLIVLAYGAVEVMEGQMSLGAMLAVNALALAFLSPLGALVSSALQLQLLGGYIERIDDVLSAEPEQKGRPVPAPQLSGNLILERVSFRYGPNSPMVVRDVSLEIAAGKSLAIVGKSGSGKSTMASLLMGLYRPSQGRILVDSRDLWELDIRTVRRQLGIVPQSPYIFGTSIRENISLTAPNASFDEVVEAARLACIHDDVIAMPMGYDSVVTDGGASLSGGQRQRIALARALIHRPAILLLDEATSSLDAANERDVMEHLASLQCTRIVIAHRLSTVASADEIIVMDAGSVVERGTHGRLIAMGGHYANLVAAQQEAAQREVV